MHHIEIRRVNYEYAANERAVTALRDVSFPGTVKAEVRVTLPRPRDPLSVPFVECQKDVVGHLR
jgi:hypothetical protein